MSCFCGSKFQVLSYVSFNHIQFPIFSAWWMSTYRDLERSDPNTGSLEKKTRTVKGGSADISSKVTVNVEKHVISYTIPASSVLIIRKSFSVACLHTSRKQGYKRSLLNRVTLLLINLKFCGDLLHRCALDRLKRRNS